MCDMAPRSQRRSRRRRTAHAAHNLLLLLIAFALNPSPSAETVSTTITSAAGVCGLNLLVYNNTALVGPPTVNRTIVETDDVVDDDGRGVGGRGVLLNFSLPSEVPISAEVIGTMTPLHPPPSPEGDDGKQRKRRGKVTAAGSYLFSCDFGIATVGFLFVDDHMVCQTGAFTEPGRDVTHVDDPLRQLNKGQWPIRLEMWHVPTAQMDEGDRSGSGSGRGDSPMLRIGVVVEYLPDHPSDAAAPDERARARYYTLSPHLPPPELKRRELQRGMLASGGWGTWNHRTLLDQVHLPSGVRINTAICTVTVTSASDVAAAEERRGRVYDDGYSEFFLDDCVEVASPDDNARAGILALDRSYGHFHVFNSTTTDDRGRDRDDGDGEQGGGGGEGGRPSSSSSWNVSVTFSGGRDLDVTLKLVDDDGREERPRLAVVVTGGPLWHRAADVSVSPPHYYPAKKNNGTTTTGTGAAASMMTLSPWGLDELTVYASAAAVTGEEDDDDDSSSGGGSHLDVGVTLSSSPPSTTPTPRRRHRLSSGAIVDDDDGGRRPRIVLPLAFGGIVALTTRPDRSVETIRSDLEKKRVREMERLRLRYDGRDGDGRDHDDGGHHHLPDVAAAVQAGVSWNVIYVPTEAGPVVPVSRGWNGHLCHRNGYTTEREWCYVLFEWDNVFASYILSTLGGGGVGGGDDDAVDDDGDGGIQRGRSGDGDVDVARDLAYSNLIQIIKSKTSAGFVPNYASGTDKSIDRTEPPVAATVLLEIYRRYGDVWIVELLFEDLLDWNDWFFSKRVLPPLDLIALGGTSMQHARFESGLDNSPMYDGEDYFDDETSRMLQYDVGFSSLVAAEAKALAELADVVGGRADMATVLRERGRSLGELVERHLWDEEMGVYVNKFSINGTFHRRVSPTSFYPLLLEGDAFGDVNTAVASEAWVNEMVNGWLFNSSRFCLTPRGNFEGNSDDCYWGLPSISADDPAYLKGDWIYWRGYVWGPMAQIVYWALLRHDNVPSARAARVALCRQMTDMMMGQWVRHGHICENYGSRRDSPDCTGNKFYHWGGLAGLISLLEYEVEVAADANDAR